MATRKTRGGKKFLGAYIDTDLKEEVKSIAKTERRSLNGQVEIFLAWGVQHLKAKKQAV